MDTTPHPLAIHHHDHFWKTMQIWAHLETKIRSNVGATQLLQFAHTCQPELKMRVWTQDGNQLSPFFYYSCV